MEVFKISEITDSGEGKVYEVNYPSASNEVIERHRLGFLEQNAIINEESQKDEPDEVKLQFHSIEAVQEICPSVLEISWPDPLLCFRILTELRIKLIESFNKFEAAKVDMTYHFEHNGHTYYLDKFNAKKALGIGAMKAYESVEYLEMQRVLSEELKEYKDGVEKFNYGKQYFLGLQSIALLCRRADEKLPRTPDGIRQWTKQRAQELADITTDIHQNVCFFLLRTLSEYRKTQSTNTHLKESQKLASGKSLVRKSKRRRKPKRSAKT